MKQIITLIVLLLVAGGLVFYSQWRPARQTVSGFIEAHDIRIGSRVGGRIQKVLAEEGDRVKAGQPLLIFDPFDLNQRQLEARATLTAKQAELERLTRGFRPEEIAEAEARRNQLAARLAMRKAGPRAQEKVIAQQQLEAAEAVRARAQEKYDSTLRVFRGGQATSDEMAEATQRLKDSIAQLEVRRQELSLAKEGTRQEEIAQAEAQLAEAEAAWQLSKNGYRSEEIAVAAASVKAAEAALGVIQEQLDELTVKAPVDGIIEALDLRPGDLVSANAPVLTLMDTSTLWVRAYVPSGQSSLAMLDKIVPITIDTYPGERFQGQITYISPQAEFTPRNVQTIEERSKQVFRIKVTLKDGLDKLRPGMIGDVWLGK